MSDRERRVEVDDVDCGSFARFGKFAELGKVIIVVDDATWQRLEELAAELGVADKLGMG